MAISLLIKTAVFQNVQNWQQSNQKSLKEMMIGTFPLLYHVLGKSSLCFPLFQWHSSHKKFNHKHNTARALSTCSHPNKRQTSETGRSIPYWTATVWTDGHNCFSECSRALFILFGMRGGFKIIQWARQELLASLASKLAALWNGNRDEHWILAL